MRDDHDFRREEELRLRDEDRRIAAAKQNAAIARLVQLIYFAVGALAVLLALRVLLRLFGANPDNQFAKVIHDFQIRLLPRSLLYSELPNLVNQ